MSSRKVTLMRARRSSPVARRFGDFLHESWMPIDSAPKDGTTVLVWSGGDMHLAFYVADQNVWMQKDYELLLVGCKGPPSHWMPLPASPRS